MMEQNNGMPPVPPKTYRPVVFPAGKKELLFAAAVLVCALIFCNFTVFGGFNLGFAIGTVLCMACSLVYLWKKGTKKSYPLCVLALCAVITAGFARTDDSFVKFVMVCFLFVGINMSFAQFSGQNRWNEGGLSSLGDGFDILLLTLEKMSPSFQGIKTAVGKGGKLSKNGISILLGLAIAVPVLAIVISLLIRADAAFDGLMKQLPEFRLDEFFATLILGVLLWTLLLSRGMALRFTQRKLDRNEASFGILAPLTLNTVLIAMCLVYVVYLVSQMAYFVGGFAGLLPEEYTMAAYARRGFFEMAWLCAVNLSVMTLSMALCRKKDPAPLLTRILCLFIGVMTVFFVATASAKMFLYIGAYGLTRLRVLTQIVMLFLALTTVIVSLWLFVPKMPYMKAVILCALVIGAAVIWVDVDTQVANYNVDAYLSGKLETVDVDYLDSLGDGAVPAIYRLKQEADSETVVHKASILLKDRREQEEKDFRSWNYVNHKAEKYLPAPEVTEEAEEDNQLREMPYAYHSYFYKAQLEAICVGDGYVCLRGWKNAGDEPLYCLCLPNGDTYEPVKSQKALEELIVSVNLPVADFGNWIPVVEMELSSNDRFAGLRGRSIEEDITLWYILDMKNNTTHGPYRTEEEYWQACYDLKAYPIGEWDSPEL